MTVTIIAIIRPLGLYAATFALGFAALPSVAMAQASTSREVVQPLPSKDVQRLNRALMQLAKRPKSVETLLEAAEASIGVNDLDAAIGFYGRAEDLAPNDARIKLGKANVYLRSGRPVEALQLYAAAQSAGADASDVLADRALAFDMVGDNSSAQTAYKRLIALNGANDEAKRRLAISYAISGNREGFEETLRPLVDRRDFASFRARAFGLAIMGEQQRATAIVDAVMPRDLAARINPYLEFMPRLTKSQQAAAANLGIFPRAADIGRDDPRIAAYTGAATSGDVAVRSAGSRLEPAGEPLGAAAEVAQSAEPRSRAIETAAVATESERVNPAASTAANSEPAFDLASVTPAPTAPGPAATVPVEPRAKQPAFVSQPVVEQPKSVSVADAFSDLGAVNIAEIAAGEDAVDLSAIEIPVEAAPEPAAKEPEKPAHPSRIWVQLATGRDLGALKYDWRRFARKAPGLLDDFEPHSVPWGQANRLLAGPVESRKAASDLINALKAEGIETFRFTSPEGTEITKLK